MREFSVSAPEQIQVKYGAQCRDVWRLYDSLGELAASPVSKTYVAEYSDQVSWAHGTTSQANNWALSGKPALVAPSDALMSALESKAELVQSASRRVIDDVAGAVPNVQAHIAGLPCAMRRVIRETSNHTPLAIIVSIGVSACLSQDIVAKRGAALLALVRLLSARRAVELHVMVQRAGDGVHYPQDNAKSTTHYYAARIDTAPLDITRAAYMLCDVSASRALLYARLPRFGTGDWPYGRGQLSVADMTAVCKQAFPNYELFCLPGLSDKSVTAPVEWILDKLRQYGEHLDESA